MAMDEIVDGLSEVSCDVLVIGGGTARPMAAVKANEESEGECHAAREGEREKDRVRSRWAWTAEQCRVIPGYATPEQLHQGDHDRESTASSIR